MSTPRATVVGAGLAGSEAAYQIASRGIPVTLIEMRPASMTPAHTTGAPAELVCSNSMRSDSDISAAGVLKREMERLGSLILAVARATSVPAGAALAVDRARFSETVGACLESIPGIDIVRREARELPDGPCVIATGPLTSEGFEPVLDMLVGPERLAFFDAAAPIIEADSLLLDELFHASRYGKGGGADYLNAPMDEEIYRAFVTALTGAERVARRDFEQSDLFQACQPVEEIARRGTDALRFGALKPVGLEDPATGRRPYAVIQLRAETREATAYNLVGFQTNLTFGEQRRVFGMIPGLAEAEFLRYGVMHRNTFVDSPRLLDTSLSLRERPDVFLAGQLTGSEGYLDAAATGLLAGVNLVARLKGQAPVELPKESALGALIHRITDPSVKSHQPQHANFGLVPPLAQRVRGKEARYTAYADRASASLQATLEDIRFETACPSEVLRVVLSA